MFALIEDLNSFKTFSRDFDRHTSCVARERERQRERKRGEREKERKSGDVGSICEKRGKEKSDESHHLAFIHQEVKHFDLILKEVYCPI